MSRADSELWTTNMTMTFQAIDNDGDGIITAADLDAIEERLAQAFAYPPATPEYERYAEARKAWTDHLLYSLDKSGDDQISRDEWLAFFSDASDANLASWCDMWAGAVCTLGDDDGQLTFHEYIAVALACGASVDAAEAAYAVLDTDGSGYIRKDVLARFMLEYTSAT